MAVFITKRFSKKNSLNKFGANFYKYTSTQKERDADRKALETGKIDDIIKENRRHSHPFNIGCRLIIDSNSGALGYMAGEEISKKFLKQKHSKNSKLIGTAAGLALGDGLYHGTIKAGKKLDKKVYKDKYDRIRSNKDELKYQRDVLDYADGKLSKKDFYNKYFNK